MGSAIAFHCIYDLHSGLFIAYRRPQGAFIKLQVEANTKIKQWHLTLSEVLTER